MSKLYNAAAWLAVITMFMMVAHILIEIVLRSFFATSTYVLDEFVGYGVAAVTFLALGRAVQTDDLIRVSLVGVLPSKRLQLAFEAFSLISAFVICSGLGYFIALSISRNFTRGRVSETIAEVPLWIPEFIVLVGLLVFLISVAHRLLTTVRSLIVLT